MTEAEAKTKWCPAVRFIPGGFNNRPSSNDSTATCIGSACMAWRTLPQGMGPQRVHPDVLAKHWTGWTVTDSTPDERGYVGISPPNQSPTGYCGLAGAPR